MLRVTNTRRAYLCKALDPLASPPMLMVSVSRQSLYGVGSRQGVFRMITIV